MDPDAETRIAALEAELAAVRAEMQQLTATVSHDLRAPLRHITAFAQLVREDAGPLLPAEVHGFLDTMTDSARHMGVLLDGLLELSRIGSMPLHIETVPLRPLVEEVCAELTAKYGQRSVAWHLPQELPSVLADAGLLRQVLRHILDNAVKFTAPRAVAVVEVLATDCETKVGVLKLEITDNGVGFNPALQEKLFKVFGRLHNGREFDGLGMGLACSRKALQRLHGAIAIEATNQPGCRVLLTLPCAVNS